MGGRQVASSVQGSLDEIAPVRLVKRVLSDVRMRKPVVNPGFIIDVRACVSPLPWNRCPEALIRRFGSEWGVAVGSRSQLGLPV